MLFAIRGIVIRISFGSYDQVAYELALQQRERQAAYQELLAETSVVCQPPSQ